MKRSFITVLSVFVLTIGVVKAQSVADGVKDLYSERYQAAKATFEKLIAANPNDIEATYWLGQTLIKTNNVPAAKALYEKALTASANAPLVIVGMGQVELMQNKISEARQRFETAITMTSGKKGGDPQVLNAVGYAITSVYTDKEKKGDINYAVEKLKEASLLKTKDTWLAADIWVNLGDAVRKANPGQGGGEAYTDYQKAIEVNPAYPVPYFKMAKLFNTQRNWDLYQQNLEKAIEKDPKFAPAYYDLYYFKLTRQDFNNAEHYATLFTQNSDPDPQNAYLGVQTKYVKKQYDEAIAGAMSIASKAGEGTKAVVYKLLAYSYVEKGDTASARQYIDKYFAKATDEDLVPKDYTLMAMIYSTIPGQEAVVLKSYQDGVKADTSLDNKITLIKDGIKFFEGKKKNMEAAQLYDLLFQTKPADKLNIQELFGATLANYRSSSYTKSYDFASQMATKFPDQIFGWEWKFNNLLADTLRPGRDSLLVPEGMNLLAFTNGDSVKYAAQIRKASYPIALYFNNKKQLDSAIKYLEMMRSATPDVAQKESIQNNINQLREVLKKGGGKPSASSPNAASTPRKPEG